MIRGTPFLVWGSREGRDVHSLFRSWCFGRGLGKLGLFHPRATSSTSSLRNCMVASERWRRKLCSGGRRREFPGENAHRLGSVCRDQRPCHRVPGIGAHPG